MVRLTLLFYSTDTILHLVANIFRCLMSTITSLTLAFFLLFSNFFWNQDRFSLGMKKSDVTLAYFPLSFPTVSGVAASSQLRLWSYMALPWGLCICCSLACVCRYTWPCLCVGGFESREQEPGCWSHACAFPTCVTWPGSENVQLSISSRSFCCGETWWFVTYHFHALLVIYFPGDGVSLFGQLLWVSTQAFSAQPIFVPSPQQ